jgi:peptidoglycan/LPS O-acetylase OafA/YrhL
MLAAMPSDERDRQRRDNLPALTGLRFFAALAVLISHFAQRDMLPAIDPVVWFLDGGRTAVSLFFVLSGFILTYNYIDLAYPEGRRAFYVARFARIYPTVVLALALGAVATIYAYVHRNDGLLLDWFHLSANEGIFLVGSFFAQATMAVGWLPAASLNQPWNSPAWSITCEMFFYALFPFLIGWARAASAHMLSALCAFTLVGQIAWVFVVAPLAPEGQQGFLISQFPIAHLFEFVLGMTVGILFVRGFGDWLREGRRRNVLLLVALAGIVALSLTHPVRPAYLLVTPFFAVLVLALAVPPRRGLSWLAWRPLMLLGEASFALYLIHVPVINIIHMLPMNEFSGVLALVVSLLLSILIFKWYEGPARRHLRRILTPRRDLRVPHH